MLDAVNSTKKVIKVLFPSQFPSVSTRCGRLPHIYATNNCLYPGLMVEIIKVLASYMNAEIEAHTLEMGDGQFTAGTVHTNQSSGLMGYVSDGTVDTLAYPLQITVHRARIFDFSHRLYNVESNILHRRNTNQMDSLWAFFTIYDSISWGVMASILFIQILFYISFQYFDDYYKEMNFRTVTNAIFEAVQLQLGQTMLMRKSYAQKFNIVVTHFLHYVILLGVYSSWLFSQKITHNKLTRIEGYPELIRNLEQSRRYFVTTTGQDWFFEKLHHSQGYPYNSMRSTLKYNPIVVTGSKKKTLDLAANDDGLVVVMDDDESAFMARSYCGLTKMGEPISASVSTAHLIFQKGSPYVDMFNDAIRNNTLQILRIYRKYITYMNRKHPKNCEDETVTKISNNVTLPYYGLCLTWAMMIGASILFFFVEYTIAFVAKKMNKFRQRKRRQKFYID